MAPKIEIVHDEKLALGEGPHWDHKAKVLYYVDIFESVIFKYDPSTTRITRVIVDKTNKTPVSWVIPLEGSTSKFIIGYGRTIAVLSWDGVSVEPTSLEVLVEVEHGTKNRFNDGKADPSGRLWGGTMSDYQPGKPELRKGTFYSLNKDGKSVRNYFGNVGISNGLAWPADHKTMYYNDTYNRTVDAFDFNIDTGDILNRRVAFDMKKNNIAGGPDGMTIDKDDKLWVAGFGSSLVFQVDPKLGTLLQSIKFPVPAITSCVWGGANLDELYVTCASMFDTEELPQAGRLFKVTGLGTSGLPGVPVKLY